MGDVILGQRPDRDPLQILRVEVGVAVQVDQFRGIDRADGESVQ